MFGIRIRKKIIPDPWGKKAPDLNPQHCRYQCLISCRLVV
jgi:hypothetical protein